MEESPATSGFETNVDFSPLLAYIHLIMYTYIYIYYIYIIIIYNLCILYTL